MNIEGAFEPTRIFEFERLLSPRYGTPSDILTDIFFQSDHGAKSPHNIKVRFVATDVITA